MAISAKRMYNDYGMYTPRTQKAKGVMELLSGGVIGLRVESPYPIPIERVEPYDLIGKFVRPCPLRPRHGFVESRYVSTAEEAKKIIAETLAEDKDAEFMRMRQIHATVSAVWTRGLLTLGPGNDGATSGRDTLSVPTIGEAVRAETCRRAGIKSAPYLEVLYEDHGVDYPTLVQLRDGPAFEGETDYIPEETVVKRVVRAEGDLLAWEKKVKRLRKGTVVHHPGGSLASHYAVHAVLSRVPVLVSREPQIGETLQRGKVQVSESNIEALRAGFAHAFSLEDYDFALAGKFMLAALHNFVAWKGKYDVLLGLGMGFAARLNMIAVMGEHRHFPRLTGGKPVWGREQVYDAWWNVLQNKKSIALFYRALRSFLRDHWGASLAGGYGGVKWYKFGLLALKMYNALVKGDANEAFGEFNSLVNAVHNGGWGFNKFLGDELLNTASIYPALSAIWVGREIYRFLPALNEERVKKLSTAWAKARTYADPNDKLGIDLATVNERFNSKPCPMKGCTTCTENFDLDAEGAVTISKKCPYCQKKQPSYVNLVTHLKWTHLLTETTAKSVAASTFGVPLPEAPVAEPKLEKSSDLVEKLTKALEVEKAKKAKEQDEIAQTAYAALSKKNAEEEKKSVKPNGAPKKPVTPTHSSSPLVVGGTVTEAQSALRGPNVLHTQYRLKGGAQNYYKFDQLLDEEQAKSVSLAFKTSEKANSYADTSTLYRKLKRTMNGEWMLGSFIVLKEGK